MINTVALPLDPLGDARKTHYSTQISPALEGQEVTVGGWVFRTRALGGVIFVILQDKFGSIQITAKKGVVSDTVFEKLNHVGNQWCLLIKGTVKPFKKAPQEVEIIPTVVLVMNTAIEQLPLDMTGVTMSDLDTRLNYRPLDLRLPRNQAIFHIQSVLLNEMRSYLIRNNYTEIMTPKIIASATEGGTELFPVMYYDREAYLSQSAQLYKERLCAVYEKVFEIGPCYRAEKSFTNRHLCEIYQLDMEIAFADYKDVLTSLENLVHDILGKVKKQCRADLEVLGQWETFEVPKVPFPIYTYQDILTLLEQKFDLRIDFGEDISTEAYRKLHEALPGYYYIVKWPMSIKPFYIHYDWDDPELSQGFDLQKGWLELSSGGTRVHEKDLLIENLRAKGLNPDSFKSHISTFDYGMPPHAGLGLGIARWLQVLSNVDQIKECVMFPRTPDRLEP